MTKTAYTIEQKGSTFITRKNGIIETKTFTEESALQSIWDLEGSERGKWFYNKDGIVYEGMRYEQNGVTAIVTECNGMNMIEIDGVPGAAVCLSDEEVHDYIESMFEKVCLDGPLISAK